MERARPGEEIGRVLLVEITPKCLPLANSQAWVIHLAPISKRRIKIPQLPQKWSYFIINKLRGLKMDLQQLGGFSHRHLLSTPNRLPNTS